MSETLPAAQVDGDNPYGALFMDAVSAAKNVHASDLHIEPTRSGLVIRMRVFGDMQEPWKEIAAEHRQPFINQVKKLAGLEIGVSGRPQDGRMSAPELGIDLRTSLLPTLYGEKIVLRLLDQDRRFVLDELGIASDAKAAIGRALQSKDGVVLISGPTGSGKTTTLYTMLASLDRCRTNIITLEDPVEYSLSGTSQVQIGERLTFAAALRAVLRQDPDVILVGEIRDHETAALAFQAASTGHLVLSTIHANGAIEVVTRLVGLGVEPFLIETTLRYSGAQRLVKRLCPACSRPAPAAAADHFARELRLKGVPAPSGVLQLKLQGGGCDQCRGGITGRIPLVEYLTGEEIGSDLKRGRLLCSKTMGQAFIERAVAGEVDITGVHSFV